MEVFYKAQKDDDIVYLRLIDIFVFGRKFSQNFITNFDCGPFNYVMEPIPHPFQACFFHKLLDVEFEVQPHVSNGQKLAQTFLKISQNLLFSGKSY